VSPPSSSKGSANRDSVFWMRETTRDRARPMPEPILVDAPTAAATLSISKRAFHSLRKRLDFPQNATVVLGPRCVRFRLEALHTFALSLASTPRREPEQRPRSRGIRPEK
jgi:predicted DNA-binding transcriptional regulator AlpA